MRGPARRSHRAAGGRCSRGGRRRPGWARATRCASRRACRCTATSWARGSRRCRPDCPGWSAGTRSTSSGEAALEAERAAGRTPCAHGARHRGPAAAARGASSVTLEGASIGRVTSGNFSPMLERGHRAGAARHRAGTTVGDPVVIEQRGRELPARGCASSRSGSGRLDGARLPSAHRATTSPRCSRSSASPRWTSSSPSVPAALRLAGGLGLPEGVPEPDVLAAGRPAGATPTAPPG